MSITQGSHIKSKKINQINKEFDDTITDDDIFFSISKSDQEDISDHHKGTPFPAEIPSPEEISHMIRDPPHLHLDPPSTEDPNGLVVQAPESGHDPLVDNLRDHTLASKNNGDQVSHHTPCPETSKHLAEATSRIPVPDKKTN